MAGLQKNLIALACLMVSTSLACPRSTDSPTPHPSAEPRSVVADDVKDIGKATQKAAKDIGQATGELADKAGHRVEDATNKAAAGSQDAWITTKVKGALTAEGLDALHVHVDTKDKVVTLSGSVDSAAHKAKAVGVAKGVTDVAEVKDHLFVNSEPR
jgi:hyperosmotically inducible periplasmic protein